MSEAVAEKNVIPMTAVQLPQVSEAQALMWVIDRAARDDSVDVEKVRQLAQLRSEVIAHEARKSFARAMNTAQAEMRPVSADASNPQTRSRYATHFALDRAIRPIYSKYGFSPSFNTEEGAPENYVRVVCYLDHEEGHQRKYQVDMPADGKGAKGNDVMTKTHATSSAITYGIRNLLKMMFNIAIGDDDDGNAAGGKVISDEQAETLKRMIEGFDTAAIAALLKYVGADSIETIPSDKYARATYAIGMKKGKASKGATE